MKSTELDTFDSDLVAALLGNIPLEIGKDGAKLKLLSRAQIDQMGNLVRESATNGNDLADATKFTLNEDNQIPVRYAVAVETYNRLGSTAPILECLSLHPKAFRKVQRATQKTWWFCLSLVLFAYAGLWLFAIGVAPLMAELRADRQMEAYENEYPIEHYLPLWPVALPYVGGLLVVILLWAILGGTGWLARRVGGHAYMQCLAKKSAISVSNLLVKAGSSISNAVEAGSTLAGLDAKSRNEVRQLCQHDMKLAVQALEPLEYTAQRLLYNLKIRLPVIVVCSLGLVIGLVYGVLIFQPLTAMLLELGGSHL